jgi:hypothetical protein
VIEFREVVFAYENHGGSQGKAAVARTIPIISKNFETRIC